METFYQFRCFFKLYNFHTENRCLHCSCLFEHGMFSNIVEQSIFLSIRAKLRGYTKGAHLASSWKVKMKKKFNLDENILADNIRTSFTSPYEKVQRFGITRAAIATTTTPAPKCSLNKNV